MTIDETIDNLEWIKHSLIADSEQDKAVDMAIKSLESWEKVKAEIEDAKIDFDINIGMEKYYNNAIDDVLQIIDKHIKEVQRDD